MQTQKISHGIFLKLLCNKNTTRNNTAHFDHLNAEYSLYGIDIEQESKHKSSTLHMIAPYVFMVFVTNVLKDCLQTITE